MTMLSTGVETRLRTRVETVRYARVRVAVIRGVDQGKTVEGAGTTLKIGTAENSDLQLKDDTVSREHCEVELNESGFRVRDARSTNGVHVGGIRIHDISSSAPLELTLGDTVLTVTPLEEAETRERTRVGRFGDLLGESNKMRELFAVLARIAPTDLSVLILGETGTGKELVAQSIHRASTRAQKPFVVFDCSAVASNLLESDLFGHERGAFTGASNSRAGALEEANGGTLFLDELGELPLELQQKLLRCLQSGEFKRVGGRGYEKTDVRVIAATHRNLRAEIQTGKFREDLYYRLEGVSVHVAPLRERLEDLPLLVDEFLTSANAAARVSSLPAGTLEMFRAHRWPGNVRELRNVVRRLQVLPELALDLGDHGLRTEELRPTAPARSSPRRARSAIEAWLTSRLFVWQASEAPQMSADWRSLEQSRRELQDAFELDYLNVLKQHSGGIKARAAHWAGVSRQAIQKLVSKHDLNWKDAEPERNN